MSVPPSLRPTRFAAKPDIRFIGPVVGRYTFPDDPERSIYACRTSSVSPSQVVLAAPVTGQSGRRVSVRLEHIGLLNGRISEVMATGFRLGVTGGDEETERLAARINWLKKHHLHQVTDKRDGPRFRPRNPSVTLEIEGKRIPGLIIDLSGSGAALSAAVLPAIGAPTLVGSVGAHVVRHFEGGFGVQFEVPHARDTVEAEIDSTGAAVQEDSPAIASE